MVSDITRRPANVVERDEKVARALVDGAKTLLTTAEVTELPKNQTYGSLWRLRRDGLVQKTNIGSRTPVWELTQEGADRLGVPLPPRAEAPAPAPEGEAPPPEAEAPAPEAPPAPEVPPPPVEVPIVNPVG
jgi:hypothetical protein